MANTLLGLTLQKNIIVLAIIDLVCEMVGAALMCAILLKVVNDARSLRKSKEVLSEEEQDLYIKVSVSLASLSVLMCVYLIQIAMSILLLFGAFQKSKLKCRIWTYVTGTILVIAVISMILNSIFGSDSGNPLHVLFPQIFLFIFKGYMIWMVHSFIAKLKFSSNSTTAYGAEYDQVDLN